MRLRIQWLCFAALVVSTAGGKLAADTVYLKNGNWIDGIVEPLGEGKILVVIGNVGKIEINLEDVYEIEKNSRTGGERHVPVDTRELKVKVKKTDAKEGSESDAAETSRTSEEAEDAEDDGGGSSPAETDAKQAGGAKGEGGEEESIDPELKRRIEALVRDLQRQKSRYRVRAERHLKAVGPAAIPFLLPLARHSSDLVRISVFRLFLEFGDERVIEAAIEALLDENEYVRDFAHRTLLKVTGEDFGYKPLASPRRREYAYRKWKKWWEEEKQALEELEKQAKRAGAHRAGDAKSASATDKKKQ